MKPNPKLGDYQLAMDCLIPMGITSENVAEKYNVSREKQDHMAYISHKKAAEAQKQGQGRTTGSTVLVSSFKYVYY